MKYEIDTEESVSHGVTIAVSKFENIAISDLPELITAIDPDALDTLFVDGTNICVSFAYSNSIVKVYNGEYLTINAA